MELYGKKCKYVTPERVALHNIFREEPGPTGYTKRNIMKGKMKIAFSLIIDHHIETYKNMHNRRSKSSFRN